MKTHSFEFKNFNAEIVTIENSYKNNEYYLKNLLENWKK